MTTPKNAIEIKGAIEIAKMMIDSYEKRGGGYSQKEALKTLIDFAISQLEQREDRGLREILSNLCDEWYWAMSKGSDKTPSQLLGQAISSIQNLDKQREVGEEEVGKFIDDTWSIDLGNNRTARFYKLAQALTKSFRITRRE